MYGTIGHEHEYIGLAQVEALQNDYEALFGFTELMMATVIHIYIYIYTYMDRDNL